MKDQDYDRWKLGWDRRKDQHLFKGGLKGGGTKGGGCWRRFFKGGLRGGFRLKGVKGKLQGGGLRGG